MAPLGIPMSEEKPFEPVRRQKADHDRQTEKSSQQRAEAQRQPDEDMRRQPLEMPPPAEETTNEAEPSRSVASVADEYRQQMRNAAILQAKQAEILQRQSEQLEYSQKLLERYDAILTRLEERQAES